jgi:hypothetical protein
LYETIVRIVFVFLIICFDVFQGFNLTYETKDCGGVVRGPFSVISSPQFPALYPSNIDCSWLLEFDQGQQIEVEQMICLKFKSQHWLSVNLDYQIKEKADGKVDGQ